jgi:Mn2+/Fe2+ NRAMP family transporter
MIGLTLYIVFISKPPVADALLRTVWPEKIDMLKIVTLVGGTVGGYISFAGAHRLLDAGIKGKDAIRYVTRSSVSGILITSLMRYLLFLAALGVVVKGIKLAADNPAASVFQSAAGELGYKFFGIVIWSAAITSVVGASFTTVSFWKTLVPVVGKKERIIISIFIIVSTLLFILIGNPVKLLIIAGAVNGFILPVALAVMLLAAGKSDIVKGYQHPLLLQLFGWAVVVAMSIMGYISLQQGISKLL